METIIHQKTYEMLGKLKKNLENCLKISFLLVCKQFHYSIPTRKNFSENYLKSD